MPSNETRKRKKRAREGGGSNALMLLSLWRNGDSSQSSVANIFLFGGIGPVDFCLYFPSRAALAPSSVASLSHSNPLMGAKTTVAVSLAPLAPHFSFPHSRAHLSYQGCSFPSFSLSLFASQTVSVADVRNQFIAHSPAMLAFVSDYGCYLLSPHSYPWLFHDSESDQDDGNVALQMYTSYSTCY